MSNGEDIDKLFREKLNSRTFEPNAQSWAAMEQLLDAQSASSTRRYGSWYWAAAVSALLVSSVFFFSNEEQSSAVVNNSLSSTETPVDNREASNKETNGLASTSASVDTNQPQEGVSLEDIGSGTNQMSARKIDNDGYSSSNYTVQTTLAEAGASYSAASERSASNDSQESSFSGFFIDLMTTKPFKSFLLSKEESPMDKVIITDNQGANKQNVALLFGANLSSGLESGHQETGTGVYIAAKYEKPIGEKISLATGVGYYNRTGSSMSNTTVDLDYSFGYEKTETTVTTRGMHMLEAPLQLAWTPRARHSVIAGASANYILNAKSDVDITYESSFNEWQETSSDWGYTEGFNRWNFALNAGYEYRINQATSIGLMYSYGLTDITNNAYYNNESFDRCQEFRLYLKYNLVNF